MHLDINVQIFFMLTEHCRAQDSDTPCDQLSLGKMSFVKKYSFIAPGSVRTHSAPGYRLTKYISPSKILSPLNFEKYVEDRNAIKAHAISCGEPEPQEDGHFRIKVYIYCPPCACQVATALDICVFSDNKDFLDFYIRIDNRQRTSCSASASRIEGLLSIVDYIKELERAELDRKRADILKLIDREWLERCIYSYTEEDDLATPSATDELARIAKFHSSDGRYGAIILLGETDYSVPLMGVPPFPPFEPGQIPRETQLFKMKQKKSHPWSWEREFIGMYTPSEPLAPRRSTPPSSTSED